MKKLRLPLATLALALVLTSTGCSNVRRIGNVNGVDLHRVTARGVFSPASTTIIASDPARPGTLETLASASGPGVLPAVATAGGVAGGAALLRPARVTNNSEASGGSNSATASGGHVPPPSIPGWVPPGHRN